MTDTHIVKMLDICTSHVTPEQARQLNSGNHSNLILYAKGEYGWVVFAHDVYLIEDGEGIYAAIRLAAQLGCDWIMFDRDSQIHPDLPTYDW